MDAVAFGKLKRLVFVRFGRRRIHVERGMRKSAIPDCVTLRVT
jgi:hypothetical protein